MAATLAQLQRMREGVPIIEESKDEKDEGGQGEQQSEEQ